MRACHRDLQLSRLLTSDELAAERDSIVNSESNLRANCEAVLLLVEPDVADIFRAIRSCLCHYLLLLLLQLLVTLKNY